MAADSAGNLYVADTYNHTLRKVTPAGKVTTLAELAGQSGGADGAGSIARFYYPSGVAVDTNGFVYVMDTGYYPTGNNTVRKISPAGVVTTILGQAGVIGSADGTGAAAQFNNATQIAVDRGGVLYIADSGNQTIRVGRPVPAQGPTLQFSRSGNQVTLFWPVSAGAFTLESAAGSPAGGWNPVPTLPLILNGQAHVTNQIAGASQFFRLRK